MTALGLRRRLSLKDFAEVFWSHIYPQILYWLYVLPIPCTIIFKLEKIVIQFIWAKRDPLSPSLVRRRPKNTECRDTTPFSISVSWAGCVHKKPTGAFWKEDTRLSFPSLRSVHAADGETHRLPRNKCLFYRERQHALKLSIGWRLVSLTAGRCPIIPYVPLHRMLFRGAVRDDLIAEVGVKGDEICLIWPWAPRMCLNNDEASLTWLIIFTIPSARTGYDTRSIFSGV